MRRAGTSMSVRARLAAFTAFLVALLLLLGGIAVRSDGVARHLVEVQADTASPARVANQELNTRMRAAERAVSGASSLKYALGSTDTRSTTESMLQPWRDLASEWEQEIGELEHLTAQPPFDDPQVAGNIREQVSALRESTQAWFDWTAPFAAPSVPGEQPVLPTAEDIMHGDRLFAVAMADSAAVQSSIDVVNNSLRQRTIDSLRTSQWVLVLFTLMAVLAAALVAWRTAAGLVGPLTGLRDTVRRQVNGEREAWADEERGAAEVRSLASDVNQLNREHTRLVDGQAQSLALLRAGNDIVAVINAASGPQAASDVVARQVGKTLGADAVRIAGWGHGEVPFAAVWGRANGEHHLIPDLWWARLRDASLARVDALDSVSVVSGRASRDGLPAWILDDPEVADTESSVFLPIVVDDGMAGMISVSLESEQRVWAESEIAYLQRVTRALARQASASRDV